MLLVNDIHFKGGGERVASYFASWYAQCGDSVYILSMDTPKASKLFPLHKNVKVDYLNVPNNKYISKYKVYVELKKYMQNHTFDYVLGIGTYANVLLGMLDIHLCKTIGCEHNSFDSVSWLWNLLRKKFYPKLNATVVLTNTDKDKMSTLNPKTFVIPNSVPLSIMHSPLKEKKILAVGKLYYQKGFDLMLSVFRKYTQYNSDWNLYIIGDGPDRKALLKIIDNLNLNNRVFILPTSDNISQEYLSASIYLMTSRYEGLPMVLLEAQAFGLPLVSYDCDTGPRDVIVDEYNGFLIPWGDEDETVAKLIELSGNEELRMQMGFNSLQNASNFTPENIFPLWDKLFSSI